MDWTPEKDVRGMTVLLIDSDSGTETLLQEALRGTGACIVRYASGRQALEAMSTIEPGLIFSGFTTEDVDGKTVFETLIRERTFARFRDVPFVLFSEAVARDEDCRVLFDLGLSGWLTKPFGVHELREVVENLMMKHEVLQRNRELRQEVRRSEFRYRDLLENANDFIFALDDDGKFVYLNNRFTPLTGYAKEEWLGKSFISLVEPADKDIALEHYRMAHQGRARVFEARIFGGQPESLVISFNITPILERGKIVGSMGIGRDVTEQKKMEREIIELTNFNESIIQSMEAGLLTVALDGRITSLNAGGERILGWKSAEVVGQKIKSVLKPEEVDCLLSSLPSPGSLSFSRETEITVKTGRKVFIGFTATDRLDNRGEKVGTIVSFRDITQLKQMQSEVIRMDRLASLGVLASGIAHEVKNPLAGIKTMAQTCEEEFDENDPKREYLVRIVRQVNRLDDLLKTFFTYARPKPPDRKPHRLPVILKEVVNLVGKKMTACGIAYEEAFESDLPKVMVDAQQIQQVFLNLILNAVEAMGDGGTLRISARKGRMSSLGLIHRRSEEKGTSDVPCVAVQVSDTGEGIAPDKLETIFDPFFSTKSNGVGLGLSIVYRIIEEHRGDIRVESKVGQGTTFTLSLPIGA